MAINLKPVDVAVVGLGAAGGVAVLPLCRAGLKVAGIEAGTWMDPHKDFKADEIHNNTRGLITTGNKIRREAPTVRNSPTGQARRGGPSPMMNAIGGTSIHYHAQSWRLKPWDFKTVSETKKRYGASYIPKGSTLEDWPIGWEDIEPYYDIAEIEVGVSGKAGNIMGKIDKEGNIFEGPRKREYPMPHLRTCDYLDHMKKAARSLGWNPFHSPAAINSVPYNGHGPCGYHGFCDRGGCHLQAKNSTCFSTIPKAQKTKNLTIFDNAQVTRINTDANGQATGVTYLWEGREYFQPAKAVLVGSYTYENSRLLLLSKSKAYPNGLGNNKGQVGKHYFGHWDAQAGASVSALFPMDLNIWYGAILSQGVVIDEWADDSFDHSGLGFIGGASMTVNTEKHPIAAASGSTWGQVPRNWGSDWKKWINLNAGRSASAYLQTNTFPYETTFLDLDPDVKDPLGDSVIRVTTMTRDNERRAALHAQDKMEEWFKAAGAIMTQKGNPNGPNLSTHTYGGTRMGNDPETSVVDKWGFSHEAKNLGMLGGSVFGTSGARNPTLTIQALAWRTAEHLVKNWKSITAEGLNMNRAGVLLLMASFPALAQVHGFAYVAPGFAGAPNGSSDVFAHFGGGVEYVTHSGIGFGGDVGGLGQLFGGTSVSLSLDGFYHFRRERKVDPFVLAGYSAFYHRREESFFGPGFKIPSLSLFNFGGGTNLWFSKHVGGVLAVRDHLYSGSGPTVHYAELMLGLGFR